MKLRILFDGKVRDFLRKLDDINRKRILKKLKEIDENPKRYMFTLINKSNFKIRVGNYRLFVDYYEKDNKLIIRSIKHRKNAYKI